MRNGKGRFDRLKAGTDHKGVNRAFAKPGEAPGLQVHHDPNDARAHDHLHGDTSIARNGAPKKLTPVSLHNGFVTRSRDGGLHTGGDAASYNANPENPLNAGPPRGKRLTPVMASPGMRSRSAFAGVSLADLSRHIFDTAHGDAGDRAALGIGTLPTATVDLAYGDCPMDSLPGRNRG
jgi:hypothetical protein